jgi:hypothetical protein
MIAPATCITVVAAIRDSTLEPLRLQLYRNQLATDIRLLGRSPTKVNTQGLLMLRKLAASAPSIESNVIFLSKEHSYSIVEGCCRWIQCMEEELRSAMTLVLFYLVPPIYTDWWAEKYWDLIFEVLQKNLEVHSLLPTNKTCAHSLGLECDTHR